MEEPITGPAPPITTVPITEASMEPLTARPIPTGVTTTDTGEMPPGPMAPAVPIATGVARLPGVTGAAVQVAIGEVLPPGAAAPVPGMERGVGLARFTADPAFQSFRTTVSDTSPTGS
jgi:hypothetical protein